MALMKSFLETEIDKALASKQLLPTLVDIAQSNRSDKLKDAIFGGKTLSPEEKETLKKQLKEKTAVNLIRGGLEQKYNITISELIEIYEDLLKNNPEKLI